MQKLTLAALAAITVVLSAPLLVLSIATPAEAKITPAQPPSCENKSGHRPPGQQPTCSGEGLEQNPATPATNPAGHAPPGQN